MKQQRKQNKYIPITDDFMFKAVFSDTELTYQLLRRILPGVKIQALNSITAENTVRLFSDTHGVRVNNPRLKSQACKSLD